MHPTGVERKRIFTYSHYDLGDWDQAIGVMTEGIGMPLRTMLLGRRADQG